MFVQPRLFRFRIATVAALAALLGATSAMAQLQNGNIYGITLTEDGAALPAVTVELSGIGAALVQLTDERGAFHFLGLSPGEYTVTATLDGFATVVYDTVNVRVGQNTAIELAMRPAFGETVTVTSESPLLDERKISAGATVTQVELQGVPTARDPWVVLETVPGVLTDTVNVGGNKSGMQQGFTAGGSANDNSYAIDGVIVTDPWAGGTSTYYNFDAFEEIKVTTGGTDASLATGGVTLDLVTQRGTNSWRGSGRYIWADDAWQSGLTLDPGELGEGQEAFKQGDRIIGVADYGLDGGGPLQQDRLWLWAHYGKNEIDRLTIDDVRDFTEIQSYGAKLNAQLAPGNSGVAFFHASNKTVEGRGAGPTRAQPATHDQSGPTFIYKLEDSHLPSRSLALTGMLSYVHGGFRETPQGGFDGPNAARDENGVRQNTSYGFDSDRDQEQAKVEGSSFFSSGDVGHELRFGAGLRRAEFSSLLRWPGDVYRWDHWVSRGAPYNIAEIVRQEAHASTTYYTSLFAQDTLQAGRLTANLGLRYDRQTSRLDAASVPGVAGFETLPDGTPLMPPVTFEGRDLPYTWEDVAPRLGLTYALGRQRRTLLRASYARFAQQLVLYTARRADPVGEAYAGFFYEDANGDGRVTVDEIVDFADGPLYTNGYDPFGQTARLDIDPALEGTRNDEVILGVEHALLPELVAGLSLTWREQHGLPEDESLVTEDGVVRPQQRSDYELLYTDTVTRPDGSTFDVPVYGLREGIEDTERSLLTRGDRGTDFRALRLTLDKRLSKGWMARGHLAWSDWRWSIPESGRKDPNLSFGGEEDDGDSVLMGDITQGWSYRIGGMARLAPERRWGFNLAGNVHGRQGYAIPYFVVRSIDFQGRRLQATADVDDYRLPALHLVDLRIDKDVKLGDFAATLGIECFNVLNRSTVLWRNPELESPRTNWIQEVVSPRIFRLYARLSFR